MFPGPPPDMASSTGLVFQVCRCSEQTQGKHAQAPGGFSQRKCGMEEWVSGQLFWLLWALFSLLLCCPGHYDLNGKLILSHHLEPCPVEFSTRFIWQRPVTSHLCGLDE